VPAISETIVREYFELHGFFVQQQRKFISHSRRDEDDEIDFLVLNPLADSESPLPFELSSADMGRIARGLVVVKGWHTDTFRPSLLANAPELFRFLEPAVFKQASRAFGSDTRLVRLLVVPTLPANEAAREQSIAMLRAKGVDAVIPFHTMLADLIEQIEVNRNYQKSDLLQVIRILKNYGFFREPQLDLFRNKTRRKSKKAETAPDPEAPPPEG
jgi:hypothetical protein